MTLIEPGYGNPDSSQLPAALALAFFYLASSRRWSKSCLGLRPFRPCVPAQENPCLLLFEIDMTLAANSPIG